MKTEQIKQLYDSPRSVIIEIKARQMLCGSPTEPQENGSQMYERDDWDE